MDDNRSMQYERSVLGGQKRGTGKKTMKTRRRREQGQSTKSTSMKMPSGKPATLFELRHI